MSKIKHEITCGYSNRLHLSVTNSLVKHNCYKEQLEAHFSHHLCTALLLHRQSKCRNSVQCEHFTI